MHGWVGGVGGNLMQAGRWGVAHAEKAVWCLNKARQAPPPAHLGRPRPPPARLVGGASRAGPATSARPWHFAPPRQVGGLPAQWSRTHGALLHSPCMHLDLGEPNSKHGAGQHSGSTCAEPPWPDKAHPSPHVGRSRVGALEEASDVLGSPCPAAGHCLQQVATQHCSQVGHSGGWQVRRHVSHRQVALQPGHKATRLHPAEQLTLHCAVTQHRCRALLPRLAAQQAPQVRLWRLLLAAQQEGPAQGRHARAPRPACHLMEPARGKAGECVRVGGPGSPAGVTTCWQRDRQTTCKLPPCRLARAQPSHLSGSRCISRRPTHASRKMTRSAGRLTDMASVVVQQLRGKGGAVGRKGAGHGTPHGWHSSSLSVWKEDASRCTQPWRSSNQAQTSRHSQEGDGACAECFQHQLLRRARHACKPRGGRGAKW